MRRWISCDWAVCAKSLQSCPTLCDPMDCSLPGSSVHGFSRQEFWDGLLFPSSHRIFPMQVLNLCLLCLLHWQVGSLPWVPPGKPWLGWNLPKVGKTEICYSDKASRRLVSPNESIIHPGKNICLQTHLPQHCLSSGTHTHTVTDQSSNIHSPCVISTPKSALNPEQTHKGDSPTATHLHVHDPHQHEHLYTPSHIHTHNSHVHTHYNTHLPTRAALTPILFESLVKLKMKNKFPVSLY